MRDLEGVVSLSMCVGLILAGVCILAFDTKTGITQERWLGEALIGIGLIAWRAGIRR